MGPAHSDVSYKPHVFCKGRLRDAGPWMKGLADRTPLCQMFVPGTHGSAAQEGGICVECQNWSVQDQLRCGIRSLDICIFHHHDGLPLCHGAWMLTTTFEGLAKKLEEFLNEHPSETILTRVKLDSDLGRHTKSFEDEVRRRFVDASKWISPDRWPCLGDVRGKVVMYHGHKGLVNRELERRCDVQDDHESARGDLKWNVVAEHSQKPRQAGVMFVNYSSAHGGGTGPFPIDVAQEVNYLLWRHAESLQPGIYNMDFPGGDLIQSIYQRYFKSEQIEVCAGRWFSLKNCQTGKRIDICGQSRKDGEILQQYAFHAGDSQVWRFESGSRWIRSKHSGLVFDVKHHDKRDEARICQYLPYEGDCHDNQRWELRFIESNIVQIICVETGKLIHVLHQSTADGTPLCMHGDTPSLVSKWEVELR